MDPCDFHDQHVRDLAYAWAGPSLLDRRGRHGKASVSDDFCQRLYADNLRWLEQLDTDPSSLHAFLTRKHKPEYKNRFRLGHYFEDLITFWLQHLLGETKVHAGLQVHHKTGTVGEFDLLSQWSTGIEHWELACKFYLCDGNPHKLEEWVGPNRKDNLAKKLNQLFAKQLALPSHPQAEAYLKQAQLWPVHSSRALVKGWLFTPLDRYNEPAPQTLSADHARGWWLRQADITRLQRSRPSSRYCILDKQQWLSPARVSNAQSLLGHQEIMTTIAKSSLPGCVMVAELTPRPDGSFQENNRGFIVPSDWSD